MTPAHGQRCDRHPRTPAGVWTTLLRGGVDDGSSVRLCERPIVLHTGVASLWKLAFCAGLPLVVLTACSGSSVTPNIAIHMTRGSTSSECTQIARYDVESTQELVAEHGTNPKYGRHDLQVNLAVIRAAADQLPASDPVRTAALRYVADGTTYPYFEPCRRLMNLAEIGELPK